MTAAAALLISRAWLRCAQASGFRRLDSFWDGSPLRTRFERSIATRHGKAKFSSTAAW